MKLYYKLKSKLVKEGYKDEAAKDAVKFIFKYLFEEDTSLFLKVVKNGGILYLITNGILGSKEKIDVSDYNTTITSKDIGELVLSDILRQDFRIFSMYYRDANDIVANYKIRFSDKDIINKISEIVNIDYSKFNLEELNNILEIYKNNSEESDDNFSLDIFYSNKSIQSAIDRFMKKDNEIYTLKMLQDIYSSSSYADNFKFVKGFLDKLYSPSKLDDLIKKNIHGIEDALEYADIIRYDLREEFVQKAFMNYETSFKNKDISNHEDDILDLEEFIRHVNNHDNYREYFDIAESEFFKFIKRNIGERWLPNIFLSNFNHTIYLRELAFYSQGPIPELNNGEAKAVYYLLEQSGENHDDIMNELRRHYDDEEIQGL